MKNIKEFCKLFKVNIPLESESQYYLETLSLSKEYKDITDLANSYTEFENWVERQGYNSVKEYKFQCLDKIVDFVKISSSYKKFDKFDYSSNKFFTKNRLNSWYEEQLNSDSPDYLISFDLSSANFNTINSFGSELGDSWEHMCKGLFIHPVLIASKSFRQIVFGNLNPKRNGKIQLMRMNHVALAMDDDGHGDRVVSINNDEVCMSLPSVLCDQLGFEKAIKVFFDIKKLLPESKPTKITVYAVKKLGKGMFKKVVLFQEGLKDEDRYVTLSGVPGNKFYRYFKTEVINKELEERDLLFVNEGELAKWVLDSYN